jgi:hypothetical protein
MGLHLSSCSCVIAICGSWATLDGRICSSRAVTTTWRPRRARSSYVAETLASSTTEQLARMLGSPTVDEALPHPSRCQGATQPRRPTARTPETTDVDLVKAPHRTCSCSIRGATDSVALRCPSASRQVALVHAPEHAPPTVNREESARPTRGNPPARCDASTLDFVPRLKRFAALRIVTCAVLRRAPHLEYAQRSVPPGPLRRVRTGATVSMRERKQPSIAHGLRARDFEPGEKGASSVVGNWLRIASNTTARVRYGSCCEDMRHDDTHLALARMLSVLAKNYPHPRPLTRRERGRGVQLPASTFPRPIRAASSALPSSSQVMLKSRQYPHRQHSAEPLLADRRRTLAAMQRNPFAGMTKAEERQP